MYRMPMMHAQLRIRLLELQAFVAGQHDDTLFSMLF